MIAQPQQSCSSSANQNQGALTFVDNPSSPTWLPLRWSSCFHTHTKKSPLCLSEMLKVIPSSRSVLIPHFQSHRGAARWTWRTAKRARGAIINHPPPPPKENHAANRFLHSNRFRTLLFQIETDWGKNKLKKSGCETNCYKWMSGGKNSSCIITSWGISSHSCWPHDRQEPIPEPNES